MCPTAGHGRNTDGRRIRRELITIDDPEMSSADAAGVSGGATSPSGKVAVRDLTITKSVDATSPHLI